MKRHAILPLAVLILSAATVSALPGLSSVWQYLYFGELMDPENPAHQPEADPDGDGWSNVLESITGTDPFDANPPGGFVRPVILPHPESPALFTIRFHGFIGKQYRLFVTADLSEDGWTPFGEPMNGNDEEIELAIDASDDEGGAPPKLFWSVAISDQSTTSGTGRTPWEIAILAAHPEIPGAGTEPPVIPEAEGPDQDGDLLKDDDDAAKNDNRISWKKITPYRYLWLPVNGGGFRAVDVNNKGQVLLVSNLAITGYATEPVGKIWDPLTPGDGMTNLYFRPEEFKLSMWKFEDREWEAPDDRLAYETVPLPGTNNELRRWDVGVTPHSIGDDGSVMANVSYNYHENSDSETPSRHTPPGSYVFLWKKDNYGSCELLGDHRGYQGNVDHFTTNFAAGFYTDGESGPPVVRAVVFDQHQNIDLEKSADLTLKSYPLTGTGPGSPDTRLVESARNFTSGLNEFPPTQMTHKGRVIFASTTGNVLRHIIGGPGAPMVLDSTTVWDSITEMPKVNGNWALGGTSKLKIRTGDGFQEAQSTSGIFQFDRLGTGIGNGEGGNDIWQNGDFINFATAIGGSTFPSDIKPKKITSNGIIWGSDASGTQNGIFIPIAVEDNLLATGVDDQSVAAAQGATGYQKQFWIMAPAGGSGYSDKTHMMSSVNPTLPLAITASAAKAGPSQILLDGTRRPVVAWRGLVPTTTDFNPSFKVGAQQSSSSPIGVKTMKRRTVKVHVYPVGGVTSFFPVIPLPDKTELTNKLNEIFAYQLNAWFEVTYMPQKFTNPDTNGDGMIPITSDEEIALANAPGFTDRDIDIILIDQVDLSAPNGPRMELQNGHTLEGLNTCVVVVGFSGAVRRAPNEIIRTIAHEIGHVMLGPGHPDLNTGVAPLEGTDRTKRLMCSGTNSGPNSNLLVKREWDRADTWLRTKPTGNN